MSIFIFLLRYTISIGFYFQIKNFWHLIKFGESFSLSSLLNQSQTYQGNPCGVYPNLSSFTRSGVIQTSVAYIKRFAPTQVHIIWYQSFGSWYRVYPIQIFFFVFCPGCVFVLVLLFSFLFTSCFILVCVLCSVICVLVLVTFLFLFLVSFTLCVKKKLQKFWKKKLGVWSLNTKLRHLEVSFWK